MMKPTTTAYQEFPFQNRQPMSHPINYNELPSRYQLPPKHFNQTTQVNQRMGMSNTLNNTTSLSKLSSQDISRMTIQEILLAGKSARNQISPQSSQLIQSNSHQQPLIQRQQDESPYYHQNMYQSNASAKPQQQPYVTPNFRNNNNPTPPPPQHHHHPIQQQRESQKSPYHSWLNQSPIQQMKRVIDVATPSSTGVPYGMNSQSTANLKLHSASPFPYSLQNSTNRLIQEQQQRQFIDQNEYKRMMTTAASLPQLGIPLQSQSPSSVNFPNSPQILYQPRNLNQMMMMMNPATRQLPQIPTQQPPVKKEQISDIRTSQHTLLHQLKSLQKSMNQLQLHQHSRDKELVTLKMELSDEKMKNSDFERERRTAALLMRAGSKLSLNKSSQNNLSKINELGVGGGSRVSSLPRSPINQVDVKNNLSKMFPFSPTSALNNSNIQNIEQDKVQVQVQSRDIQTSQTLLPISQKKIEQQRIKVQEQKKQLQTLEKQNKQIKIQIEAQSQAQRRIQKDMQKARNQFAASFASAGIQSDQIYVSQYVGDAESQQQQRLKLIQRVKQANDQIVKLESQIQSSMRMKREQSQITMTQRRQFEKDLAEKSNILFDLQKKVDNQKTNEKKAQNIFQSHETLSDENRDLKSELKIVNDSLKKKCDEQDELIQILEKSVSSLKQNISQNKNKACNNCLLYINEKQDLQLKADQQMRILQRMARDHHEDKERILQSCQEAMTTLNKYPTLHQGKIKKITQELQHIKGQNKVLVKNLQSVKVLNEKRDAVLSQKQRDIDRIRNQVKKMKDRINSHDDQVLLLKKQIQQSDESLLYQKKTIDKMTIQVTKNAEKRMILKDKQASLQEELGRKKKQLSALKVTVQALVKSGKVKKQKQKN